MCWHIRQSLLPYSPFIPRNARHHINVIPIPYMPYPSFQGVRHSWLLAALGWFVLLIIRWGSNPTFFLTTKMERVMRIELTYQHWQCWTLPLSYTRKNGGSGRNRTFYLCRLRLLQSRAHHCDITPENWLRRARYRTCRVTAYETVAGLLQSTARQKLKKKRVFYEALHSGQYSKPL